MMDIDDRFYLEAEQLAQRYTRYRMVCDNAAHNTEAYIFVEDLDLNGVKAQGKTKEAALSSLHDARVDMIAFILEHGEELPQVS